MSPERTGQPGFERLLHHLKQHRGFDATVYQRSILSQRIDARLSTLGIPSYDDYVDHLEVDPNEFEQLFNAILASVTTFFRDPDTFEYLDADIIPRLLHSIPEEHPIRIWSAGCASGEECYSLAMLFAEALGPERFKDRVKIYATDVDERELTLARQAAYSDRAMEEVPAQLRARYFDREAGRWQFKKDFRRRVIFGRHNLLDDAPISNVDLLVCRNTLMYFNREAQSHIVSRFHFALKDGGYLVLGNAETLVDVTNAFTPWGVKQRVFIKTGDDHALDADSLSGVRPDASRHYALQQNLRRLRAELDDAEAQHQITSAVLEGVLRHVPVSMIVLNADLQVERWNSASEHLWGVRAEDAAGRYFFDLQCRLPVEPLREAVLERLAAPDAVSEMNLAVTNRHGQAVGVRLLLAGIGAVPGSASRVILIVQDAHDA